MYQYEFDVRGNLYEYSKCQILDFRSPPSTNTTVFFSDVVVLLSLLLLLLLPLLYGSELVHGFVSFYLEGAQKINT